MDQQCPPPRNKIWAMSVLALGIIIGSVILSMGLCASLKHMRAPHVVTVKGLSEKLEKADLALWTLQFSATGNDLQPLQTKVEADMKNVTDFLKSQGLGDNEFTPGRMDVVDLMAKQYRSTDIKENRYILSASVKIRSDKVELVQTISRNIGTLIKSGVIFASDENGAGANSPQYVFTKINDIKLDMLAEATRNARAAAEQFARDSGEKLGSMIEANQGTFSIMSSDGVSLGGDNYADQMAERSQILKKIRVVSTVKYQLSN